MAKPKLSKEELLLICCGRREMDNQAARRLRGILAHSLDWEHILKAALIHGMAPLLYYHLKTARESIPAHIFGIMEKAYYSTAYRNIRLSEEVGKILEALNEAKIKTVILKGLFLSETIYKNPALRPSSDIDLLVQKEDLPRVTAVIERLGYIAPDNQLSRALLMKYHFNISLIKTADYSTHIELHWHLSDRFKNISIETLTTEIWANTRWAQLSGIPVQVMSPENLLIYLCLHLNNHGYMNNLICSQYDNCGLILSVLSGNRLIWFVDIYEVIKYYGGSIDWVDLIEKSRRWDKEGAITSSLCLTKLLFRADLNANVLNALNPPKTPALEEFLYRFILKRCYRDGEDDYIVKFFYKNILSENKRFRFRPIRLINMNHKALIHYVLFPLQAVFYIIRKIFSIRAND